MCRHGRFTRWLANGGAADAVAGGTSGTGGTANGVPQVEQSSVAPLEPVASAASVAQAAAAAVGLVSSMGGTAGSGGQTVSGGTGGSGGLGSSGAVGSRRRRRRWTRVTSEAQAAVPMAAEVRRRPTRAAPTADWFPWRPTRLTARGCAARVANCELGRTEHRGTPGLPFVLLGAALLLAASASASNPFIHLGIRSRRFSLG
jgi:hypothetical protein